MADPLHRTLTDLATNLAWSWDCRSTALWAELDPFRWRTSGHNPVAMLRDLEPEHIAALAQTPFAARAAAAHDRLIAADRCQTWVDDVAPAFAGRVVAYLSMEFGLHESLRLYSGGLGVLAGDHLKSASDLGVPLVGVSLLYRHGYFTQRVVDGSQLAATPTAEWDRLPIEPCFDADGVPIEISVPVEDREVRARVWSLAVGRTRLFLLDTDYDANPPHDRGLTSQLYGGDTHTRICQEILLGIGGVRALRALGIEPDVVHLNEGHCAFAPLALAEPLLAEGTSLVDAIAGVRTRCVFTTHTPVPAGHDRFEPELVARALGGWCAAQGVDAEAVCDLGRVSPGDPAETLCMTVLALRASAASNGVSALHGEVSRQMWQPLWPAAQVDAVPIAHITNGVHPFTWTAPETQALFDRTLPGWRERPWDEACWAQAADIPAEALWGLRTTLRRRLVDAVRERTGRPFDPEALTIGFARRFATYKRGDLLFHDLDRLLEVLGDAPVQFVFAGKAHPRDLGGQHILRQVVRYSERRALRTRVVLLEDYDIALGRLLTQGADLWLNTPRRPQEASGTSGQKVCLNGGLNLSVLDGWWPEGFDGTHGWAIPNTPQSDTGPASETERDAHDAAALYRLLQEEVLPTWQQRADDRPGGWLDRVRRCLQICGPRFTSHRMVRDYALEVYAPRLR